MGTGDGSLTVSEQSSRMKVEYIKQPKIIKQRNLD